MLNRKQIKHIQGEVGSPYTRQFNIPYTHQFNPVQREVCAHTKIISSSYTMQFMFYQRVVGLNTMQFESNQREFQAHTDSSSTIHIMQFKAKRKQFKNIHREVRRPYTKAVQLPWTSKFSK